MNKIHYITLAVLMLLISACQKEITREPSQVFAGTALYFPLSDERGLEFDPADGITSHTVLVARTASTAAQDYKLLVTLNEKDKYVVPATVHFGEGEATSSIEITFAEMEEGVPYSLELEVEKEYINPYTELRGNYQMSVTYVAWTTSETPAVMLDGFVGPMFGMPAYPFYCEYQYATFSDGRKMYRFLNPYNHYFEGEDPDEYGVFECFPLNAKEDMLNPEGDYHMVVSVSTKNEVMIPDFAAGIDYGYGAIYCGSVLGILDDDDATYSYGTMSEDGIITLKAGDGYYYDDGYYTTGDDVVIYLDVEVYKQHASHIEDYNTDVDWEPIKGDVSVFISTTNEPYDEAARLCTAVDPEGGKNPESELYNLFMLKDVYKPGFGMAMYIREDGSVDIPAAQPTGMMVFGQKIYMSGQGEKSSYSLGGVTMNRLVLTVNMYNESQLLSDDGEFMGTFTETYFYAEKEPQWSKADYLGKRVFTYLDANLEPVEKTTTIQAREDSLFIHGTDYAAEKALSEYNDVIVALYDDETQGFYIPEQELQKVKMTVSNKNINVTPKLSMTLDGDSAIVVDSLAFSFDYNGDIVITNSEEANGFMIDGRGVTLANCNFPYWTSATALIERAPRRQQTGLHVQPFRAARKAKLPMMRK